MLPDAALICVDSLLLSTAQSLPILLFVGFFFFCLFCSSFCWSFFICPFSLFSISFLSLYFLLFVVSSTICLSLFIRSFVYYFCFLSLSLFFFIYCRPVFLPSSVDLFCFSSKKSEITRIKYLSRTVLDPMYPLLEFIFCTLVYLITYLPITKQAC